MEPQPQPQPQLVHSVEHLRHLIGQAQPGERLLVQISPNISFKDARMLWEAASLDGEAEGVHEVFNPEMLRSKMMAADFVDNKVRELKRERDYLNGKIDSTQSWYNLKQRRLENGGPNISKSHKGMHMLGPEMYLDLEKVRELVPNVFWVMRAWNRGLSD
jgi:hypothetical protein